MAERMRILFLCTGNSCRSQMAEALLRFLAPDRFEAHSAGSAPAGFIHGLAIEAMKFMNIPMGGQESKSWQVYADQPINVTITLCDNAAREACPVFPGDPLKIHWSLPDPVYHPGKPQERFEFALAVANRLRQKIWAMTQLDWTAGKIEIGRQLQRLGEI